MAEPSAVAMTALPVSPGKNVIIFYRLSIATGNQAIWSKLGCMLKYLDYPLLDPFNATIRFAGSETVNDREIR
jgi:hypothetical protein